MRYGLLFVLFFACLACCSGQGSALMYDSQHAVSADSFGIIKRIKSPVGKKVKIVYTNGQKRKILKDELWGFRNRSGRVYRLYDNKALRIVKQKDVVKYEYKQPGTTHFSTRYSADLNSPVYRTKRKARH